MFFKIKQINLNKFLFSCFLVLILLSFRLFGDPSQNRIYNDLILTSGNDIKILQGTDIEIVKLRKDKYIKEDYAVIIVTNQTGADLIDRFTADHIGENLSLSTVERTFLSLCIHENIPGGKIAMMPFSKVEADSIVDDLISCTAQVQAVEVEREINKESSIEGIWKQYMMVNEDLLYGGTFSVYEHDGIFMMDSFDPTVDRTIMNENETITIKGSSGLYDISFENGIWAFKSKWSNDRIGVFILNEIYPDIFEGYAYENGNKKTFNRWEKINEYES